MNQRFPDSTAYRGKLNTGVKNIKPYVPGKSVQEVLRSTGMFVVKMASNENALGPSPKAVEAIRSSLEKVHQYPEVSSPELTERLSRRFGLTKEQVIVGNGSDSLIYTLAMCLINENDEVIIPEITFPLYATITNIMRGQTVISRMNGYSIDLKDILEQITDRTRMIWLCNPNNPTGTLTAAGEFCEFMDQVPDSVMVVHDEVYAEFADSSLFPETLRMVREGRSNLFVLRSFSKLYGLAGIRVGYGMGPEALVRIMYGVRPPFDVSVLAQAAAEAAVQDETFVRETLKMTAAGKQYLYAALDDLGIEYVPSHTNFLLIDTKKDDIHVCDDLLKGGFIARPSKHYRLPGRIRVTVGRDQDNRRFIEVLKSVLKGSSS